MKKGKGHKHTGSIHHTGHHLPGVGGKDPHASSEYHSANAEHGMPHGLTHKGEYDNDGDEAGGEGMADNCSYS